MGNPTSWLIFLIGVAAVAVVAIGIIIALVVGLVSLGKRRATKRSVPPVSNENADSDNVDPLRSPPVPAGRPDGDVITDTIIGLNTRSSDNRFQAIFIAVSVVSFAVVGAIIAAVNVKLQLPWFGGALMGAFAGLIFGLFASGILIMIYRGDASSTRMTSPARWKLSTIRRRIVASEVGSWSQRSENASASRNTFAS